MKTIFNITVGATDPPFGRVRNTTHSNTSAQMQAGMQQRPKRREFTHSEQSLRGYFNLLAKLKINKSIKDGINIKSIWS